MCNIFPMGVETANEVGIYAEEALPGAPRPETAPAIPPPAGSPALTLEPELTPRTAKPAPRSSVGV